MAPVDAAEIAAFEAEVARMLAAAEAQPAEAQTQPAEAAECVDAAETEPEPVAEVLPLPRARRVRA